MEVKQGYRQTEVGVIPEEWEVKAVADLVESTSPICYGVVQVGQHTESGVPIVAIKFVKEIAHAPLHRTAIRLEKPYARSRPRGGDVLISIKGTIGRVGIVPNGFEGNISRELARLRIGEDICSEYIAHQLEADATQGRIMRSVVGTTRLEFSIATLRQFQLPIPPTKAEQRAIATALSDVDGLLGGLDRLIAKKRDLKQTAMQQLLTGQTRLPGFHGEWEMCPVGSMGEVVTGKALAANGPGKQRPYLRTKNVFDGRIDIADVLTMPMTDDQFAQFGLCHGDVLLNEGQSLELVGRCAIYQGEYPEPCAIQNQLIRFRARDGVSGIFASYVFRYCQQSGVFARIALQTTSIAHLGGSRFQRLQLAWPKSETEQTAIAEVLTDMDAELAALEQRREKTRALKQAMMQELLTGRTRLMTPREAHA